MGSSKSGVRQEMPQGGCLCGEVRYSVGAAPLDIILCHCHFCQRLTGGAYLVEHLFAKENFELFRGDAAVYDHLSEGSGKVVHIHFCQRCGTKLFLTFERFPATVGVCGGTLDDPDCFPRTPENTQYFFLDSAQNGVVIPAGFEVFHQHYWQDEGVAAKPQVFDEHTVVSPEVKAAGKEFW